MHEAYLRLAEHPESIWKDRPRILALAAHAMRFVLVESCKGARRGRDGAGAIQVTLDEGLAAAGGGGGVSCGHKDPALTRLAEFDPRQARCLELHFFAGVRGEAIAAELGISARTIKRNSDDGARVAACQPAAAAPTASTPHSAASSKRMHVENVTTLAMGDDVSQLTTTRSLPEEPSPRLKAARPQHHRRGWGVGPSPA